MRLRAAIGGAVIALCCNSAPAALGRDWTFTPGPSVAAPRFHVSYSGTGQWSTIYHSTPANPGANPDTNDAHDSSSQRWSLSFLGLLSPREVGRPAGPFELSGASGVTRATGRIRHSHIDGIYAADNASISCGVAARTPPHARLPASIEIRNLPDGRGLRLTALDPVSEVLALLPPQCPGQGDSLDGLADNYFTPGFSFAPEYGPDRWFRSRSVTIPLRVLQRAERLTIKLGPGPGSPPPADCAVRYPSWQRCQTGGAWQGMLTLNRVG